MKVEVLKHKSTWNELKVISIVKEASRYSESFECFKGWFDGHLKRFKKTNTFIAEQCYECVLKGESVAGFIIADNAEIWHKNPSGDKDRMIAKVTKE